MPDSAEFEGQGDAFPRGAAEPHEQVGPSAGGQIGDLDDHRRPRTRNAALRKRQRRHGTNGSAARANRVDSWLEDKEQALFGILKSRILRVAVAESP